MYDRKTKNGLNVPMLLQAHLAYTEEGNKKENGSNVTLVTGAGGFIGHHIVKIFVKHGWKVYALVHRHIPEEFDDFCNLTIIRGDVTSDNIAEEILAKIGRKPDIVVHAAGLASDVGSDEIYRKLNFESVKKISQLYAKKFIFISSTDVYGIKDFSGEDEDSLPFETNFLSPYPKYKVESEKWITSNIPADEYVILRPAAVYGEGDKTIEKRVLDFLATSPFIVNFGKWKGQNRWPAANVETVAKVAYATAVFDDFNGESINIIDEKKITIDEYYRSIARRHFPQKKFKSITLPFWFGKIIGWTSTTLSNMLRRTSAIFDPSFYALHHVSSNLDFSCEKQKAVLEKYENS
ncbi:oxidoreductase [Alphaproteobacteria bacterium]|nr:oxidoreductase [Alphaproteobacteria bacterium]